MNTAPSASPELQAILFDLDGTLVDTAPGLAAAANRMRVDAGLQALPISRYRPQVSRGSRGLVREALGDAAVTSANLKRFLELYRSDLTRDSGLFPGQGAVLNQLEARGLAWGVVTNKPAWLSEPLLQALGLLERLACLVCGDQVAHAKPAPEALEVACEQLRLSPAQVGFVGDAPADEAAAAAAGTPFFIAGYGYLDEITDWETWRALGYLPTPEALLDWLTSR